MSKNWKQEGWNQMESLLDEAMPVQRRPLFPPIPVPLRIAALAFILTGSAYWAFHTMNSAESELTLNAIDFSAPKDFSAEIATGEAIKNPHASIQKKSTPASTPILNKHKILSNTYSKVSKTLVDVQKRSNLATIDNSAYRHQALFNAESMIAPDHSESNSIKSNIADNSNTDTSTSPAISAIAEKNESNAIESFGNEAVSLELSAAHAENLQAESVSIFNPKLNPYLSIGASAGNYTFSGATLYGELQFKAHIPLSKSFNLSVLAGAGKGLLYQNTEVLLAEYSNNDSNGSNLGAEAPGDDLSAFVDLKSVTNVLGGAQIQWQFAGNWTFALGANATYLFNIQHQAIQSTSLVPQGQSPQQIFTPSEITERFVHWNHWDLRMNASIQYHMTGHWSMALSYNRGIMNLLKHPISGDHDVRMNSLSIGLNYRF